MVHAVINAVVFLFLQETVLSQNKRLDKKILYCNIIFKVKHFCMILDFESCFYDYDIYFGPRDA